VNAKKSALRSKSSVRAAHNHTEEVAEEAFQPLSAQEARQWRLNHPQGSLWHVLAMQLAAGVAVAALAGLLTGRMAIAWSVAYGVLAVVGPAALFLRGTVGRLTTQAGGALLNLFLWEFVKIVLTVVLLVLAPRLVRELSWPGLLIGLVVAVKVYWLSLMRMSLRAARRPN
jgi:ATP synthase protein I